ncbi:uncharacterized protein LOC135926000 [Gordionus sp. m RMFG-2023]|uniref:uncharacterized protein LOC135926000 n=1 Tax=Gordionus sp. m RMFG-2023 TaxID=3053472 RepID=UPI0031FC0208
MIFADDFVILAESKDEMVERLETEYMVIGDEIESIDINEWQILPIEKIMGSTIQTNGSMEKEIKKSLTLKGKDYSSIVQPTILYSLETWPTKESDERSLQTMDMRMLRMIAGVSRKDKVRTRILEGLKVVPIKTKIRVNRLRWYGHTMRRPMNYIGYKVESLEVMGKRKRGRLEP